MSDEFKRKLAAYEKGELTDAEIEDFEKELDKLESYHEFLEDNQGDETSEINQKKQKKILRRGKWKARVQTAFFALAIFVLFTIVASIFTSIYYAWGTPDRNEVLASIIDHTLTVTDPYGYMGHTSTHTNAYFSMTATREMTKRVGDERIEVGEMNVNFIFSKIGIPEEKHYGTISQNRPQFIHPASTDQGEADWEQLEKLPEGTVVSAYLSFSELIGTEQVLSLFEEKDMELLWLAVDTGKETDWNSFSEPIGFPSYPIWHQDDMILTSHEEEEGPFWSKTVSEGYVSPDYEEGDEEILHQQFLKTLRFLKEHENMTDYLTFGRLNLSERIDYLENNGFLHYGVVITGPTKEVLKLREESWVKYIDVDEVAFWNWDR
ncbi:anti-sigma factor [Radiobacillus sp. PE A8.2]|uniref:anti-sigma factor n=1 Tax=Radiobacillus sp. PE A8.2 TaxID=3380349 RepID=UPI00388EC3CF